MIIVSGLLADFEMECRILENNPAGLNRAEIERAVGNQYNRLLRQQQDSKALSASKGTVTANRGKGKNRKRHHKFDDNCFNYGKKGHRAGDCRSAKKKSEESGAADDRKEGGGSSRCYICGSEEHLAHRHCGLCKSLEHRTRDCEERGAEKGAMLAKLTVPVVPEVRAVVAVVGAARSDRKKEWESDSGVTFYMSHTRAGMSAYKKASPGTNVEIADGNILPVGGFGRIEVDLDQPGQTTKMVKMDDVAYVPGLSRNLLSTVKTVEQWGKPLIYYRNKDVLGFPGEESLVFKFCPRRGLSSATGARRIPRQEVALEANLTENRLVKVASGTALAMRAGASRDVMEVHRMLAHPSEDITRNTTEMMGTETTGQCGACETCFQTKAKRHVVPKKTIERATVRGQRFFVDVGGPMKHSSLGGNSYVVIFVDDCTRFKVVKFVKKKSDTTAALLSLIADYITPQKLSIKCVRMDNGGEFEGEFQRELDRRSITHEHTPPDTPQYNGVAERALGLLREKAIILMEELDDVINLPREKVWAQAMLFACDVTNKSVTTSTDRSKSPYELWFGKLPTADHLRPFGAVGYARPRVREHKMAPKGEKWVFMGITHNFPTDTVSVLLVRTRNIVERRAVQWIDGPKKTGGDGTGSDDRGMKSAGDETLVERGTPQLNVQKLGQEQQLTLHEHETQEAFSEHEGETQGALLSELEEETQEAFSEHEREQQHKEGGAEPASGSANLEGPALPALRKLTIDGNIPPILSSRTRCRKSHTGVE